MEELTPKKWMGLERKLAAGVMLCLVGITAWRMPQQPASRPAKPVSSVPIATAPEVKRAPVAVAKEVKPANPFALFSTPTDTPGGQPEPLFGIIVPPTAFPKLEKPGTSLPPPPGPLANIKFANMPKPTVLVPELPDAKRAEAAIIRILGSVRKANGKASVERIPQGDNLEIRIQATVPDPSVSDVLKVAAGMKVDVVGKQALVDPETARLQEDRNQALAKLSSLRSFRESLLTSYPPDAKVVTDVDEEIAEAEKTMPAGTPTEPTQAKTMLSLRFIAKKAS